MKFYVVHSREFDYVNELYHPIKIILFILGLSIAACHADNTELLNNPKSNPPYLQKPTGPYNVGYEKFHWINKNICPDLFFSGQNWDDFSVENKEYCHEIFVRVYYPSSEKYQPTTQYYQPFLTKIYENYLQPFTIPKQYIKEFYSTQSFSTNKPQILSNRKFPVIFFSPGHSMPAEGYENIITELVSYGYIVVGIDTPFNSPVELANGHLVRVNEFKSPELMEKSTSIQEQDLMYVYDRIKKHDISSNIFSAMALERIGIIGHSIGACLLTDVGYNHPKMFQAAATLDICYSDNTPKRKQLIIPLMHQISASHNEADTINLMNSLGDDGYLVGITPNKNDHRYTEHINFTDISTLQYTPAFQTFDKELKIRLLSGFDLKLMSHQPSQEERESYNKPTYVLVKLSGKWKLTVYVDTEISPMDIRVVDNLQKSLDSLSRKSIEKLTHDDIKAVLFAIKTFHNKSVAENLKYIGKGNGWDITAAMNIYLLQFFNTYLKGETNQSLLNCDALSDNTYMKCGPLAQVYKNGKMKFKV